MSRNIADKSAVTITEAEFANRKTDDGKLIFTRYQGKNCALLIKRDKLTLAAFPEDSRVGTIFIGRVSNVVKNINACFVEIGPGEVCFLALKDASAPFLFNRVYDGRILVGDELLVQVVKDAQKGKQPSVTAHISFANDYFVLTLGLPGIGFSAKLSKEQKNDLEHLLKTAGIIKNGNSLNLPADKFPPEVMEKIPFWGLTVRTRAAELAKESPEGLAEQLELAAQFRLLSDECAAFLQNAIHRTCFTCLKCTNTVDNMMARLLSQLAAEDEFTELVTDDPLLYTQLEAYQVRHLPDKSLRLYEDPLLPLVKLYSLKTRIEEALAERVWLKSGGYLMIQPTEALTVIDVNSGKYEGRKDTFLQVNLEAAEEIARQIRLRNLSGIIIVDFINMQEKESRVAVMDCLKKQVHRDKVKTVVVDMTSLGLVEITRKKITKPLKEALR